MNATINNMITNIKKEIELLKIDDSGDFTTDEQLKLLESQLSELVDDDA